VTMEVAHGLTCPGRMRDVRCSLHRDLTCHNMRSRTTAVRFLAVICDGKGAGDDGKDDPHTETTCSSPAAPDQRLSDMAVASGGLLEGVPIAARRPQSRLASRLPIFPSAHPDFQRSPRAPALLQALPDAYNAGANPLAYDSLVLDVPFLGAAVASPFCVGVDAAS
jgi:hypothetical protein